MPSIKYKEVYSNFFLRVEAYDLLQLPKTQQSELLCNWLHSAVSYPYIRRLFSTLEMNDTGIEDTIDDEQTVNPDEEEVVVPEDEITVDESEDDGIVNGTITYELKYVVEEEADKAFLIEILGAAMGLAWVKPKVISLPNLRQVFGSSAEKYYSQASHLAELRNVKDDLETEVRNLIRDRGFANNEYLDGNSASARMRQ
jgi:hypothetical protein